MEGQRHAALPRGPCRGRAVVSGRCRRGAAYRLPLVVPLRLARSTPGPSTGERPDPVERLFVTGVSPIAMDDAASGFNISAHLGLRPGFNEVPGFTEADRSRVRLRE